MPAGATVTVERVLDSQPVADDTTNWRPLSEQGLLAAVATLAIMPTH